MKASTLIVLLLFIVSLIPSGVINTNSFSVDRNKSEGYVAFVANDKDVNVDITPEPSEECQCGGSKEIIHGDGHRTPCQCINSGGPCNCKKKVTSIQKITYFYSSKDPCSNRFINSEIPSLININALMYNLEAVDVDLLTGKKPSVPSFEIGD